MSGIDDGQISNRSGNEEIHEVIEKRLARRSFLSGAAAAIAAASIGNIGSLLAAVPVTADQVRKIPLLGFQSIPVSTADSLSVPKGYSARVLIAWGDPVSNGPAFRPDADNTADEQGQQWGMHNDGLVYFPINGSARGLIVQNNEYTDDVLLFPDGVANWNASKTLKSQNAHGVSIVEVTDQGQGKGMGGVWKVVRPSKYARRITARTPINIAGPAAGDPRLKTRADATGKRVLGTLNNCAMGLTPWGTYLTCEENFDDYFRKTGSRTQAEIRYGIMSTADYRWYTTDTRFDANIEPNEANRFGWIVEIDPFDPRSTPVKRTALGRFKHEGAKVQEARDGRVVVYSGDDEQFEYIYRYVSRLPWRQSRRQGINPLDDGTLYVAKFHSTGQGEWLPLTPDNPKLSGWTLSDILINTRTAADLVGATAMDRPEWVDTFPDSLTAIATLTNNTARGTAGTNPRTGLPNPGVDTVNPRARNAYGHIITWEYAKDWTDNRFKWEIFALAGGKAGGASDGSSINGDIYGAPDGIYVAPSGRLWIQTDVSSSKIDPENRSADHVVFGNNQMLCADVKTRETRRFLVGPNTCEITGVFVTPDERTMFVGIQHPGESPVGENDPSDPKRYSSWPEGKNGGRPRSALVVITKDDGGVIGS
jgi:secreted PhoX family phosphatase